MGLYGPIVFDTFSTPATATDWYQALTKSLESGTQSNLADLIPLLALLELHVFRYFSFGEKLLTDL